MVGQTLGHYRILGKLGAGGMGVVYKAEDTALQRIVVIKVIGGQSEADETARARLLREARMAASLNHPNICTIHEVGESAGQVYIAMEYIEGRPLSEAVREGLDSGQALRQAAQIADALAHAHERGVVHRDLKSANVMITPEGRVKVLDFGLAKRLPSSGDQATISAQNLTQTGAVVGTLAYMAPEVLKGAPADERSDLWALGVMLHEALAGALPFQGSTVFEATSAILRESPPALPDRLPPGVRAIVERLLAKEPGQRYQRAGEVRAALEMLHSGPSMTMAAPALPAKSRRKLLILSAAAVSAAGVAFLGGRSLLKRQGPTLSSGDPVSPVAEANVHFERGFLFLTRQNDPERALEMMKKALDLDPKFASARAWYGFCHGLLFDFGISNDPALLYKAERELRQALQDNPNLARAHSGLAGVFWWQMRKDLVPDACQRALQLNPDDMDAHIWLSVYHQYSGDHAAAGALIQRLVARDPLLLPALWAQADIANDRGDVKGSLELWRKLLDQDPTGYSTLASVARLQMGAGKLDEAQAALDRVRPEHRKLYPMRMHAGLLSALEGKRDEARKEVDGEVLKYYSAMLQYMYVAVMYFTAMGEIPTALDWLDRATRAGDERVEYFRREPLLAALRSHPRFQQILESAEYRRAQRKPKL